MIDPKRMERIWAACPELRPEALEICKWHDGSFMAWSFYGLQITSKWSTLHNGEPLLHALIRDKCTLWLAEESFYFVPVAHSPKANKLGGWCFQLMGSDMAKEHLWCESGANLGPDPTEACLLACERVLGLPEWDATTSTQDTHTPPE